MSLIDCNFGRCLPFSMVIILCFGVGVWILTVIIYKKLLVIGPKRFKQPKLKGEKYNISNKWSAMKTKDTNTNIKKVTKFLDDNKLKSKFENVASDMVTTKHHGLLKDINGIPSIF